MALLGENGAGKTTLLHCLANRLRPCGGEVLWFGNSPRRRPEDHRLVGLVAHESSLYPELTIRQNLSFAARMFGISDVRGRVAAQLACAGMERLADRSVSSLSRGQRQRVEILRAVVHSPSLVLLDEPYSGLDVFGRQWLEEKMAGWRSEGKAVCFTSHDEPHCFRVAERVLRLDGGKLLPVSRPAD